MTDWVAVVAVAEQGSLARVTIFERPWSINAQRYGRRNAEIARARAEAWRLVAASRARELKLPRISDPVDVHAVAVFGGRGPLQDTGNCYPAIKATLDGLVDAHVLVDDGPRFVRTIVLHPAERTREGPGSLTLILQPAKEATNV